jgi:DNA-binding PadR family transcriptional regulator
MKTEKSLVTGSASMLLLKLLEEKDMYGYQMIDELSTRSNNVFELKAGTLYPLLHALEQDRLVASYSASADSARVRKYYSITGEGRRFLKDKRDEWDAYSAAVNSVLGGAGFARA